MTMTAQHIETLQTLITTYGADTVAAAVGAMAAKECKRCNHVWLPRTAGTPKQCPRCKSVYWGVER